MAEYVRQPSIAWIGSIEGELGWCLDQLRIWSSTEANTHGIGAGFLSSVFEFDSDILAAGIVGTDSPIDLVIVASDSRGQDVAGVVERAKLRFPQLPFQLLLSSWWEGHRRSHPLGEYFPVAYWHQLADVVFPMIIELGLGGTLSLGEDETRVKRILRDAIKPLDPARPTLTLVVTEGRANSEFWQEILFPFDFFPIICSPKEDPPQGNMSSVIIDLQPNSRPSENQFAHDVADSVEHMRSKFPGATIVVCSGFPRWDQWQTWQAAGGDLLLSKPFMPLGFATSLRHLNSRQPIPRVNPFARTSAYPRFQAPA